MFEENENPERSAWVRAKGACEVAEIFTRSSVS